MNIEDKITAQRELLSRIENLEFKVEDFEWRVFNDNSLLNDVREGIAGEAIDASTTSQSVYKDTSDGKIYLTDADDSSSGHRRFYGFVDERQSVVSGEAIKVRTQGKVFGFTGLTDGAYLYLSDTAGAVSETPSTTAAIRVAQAISSTEAVIIPKAIKQIIGSVSKACNNSDQTTTVTLGWRPKLILVYSVVEAGDLSNCNADDTVCSGSWSDSSGQGSVCNANSYTNLSTSDVAVGKEGSDSGVEITIQNITNTGFDIFVEITGSGLGESDVFYVAIGE